MGSDALLGGPAAVRRPAGRPCLGGREEGRRIVELEIVLDRPTDHLYKPRHTPQSSLPVQGPQGYVACLEIGFPDRCLAPPLAMQVAGGGVRVSIQRLSP